MTVNPHVILRVKARIGDLMELMRVLAVRRQFHSCTPEPAHLPPSALTVRSQSVPHHAVPTSTSHHVTTKSHTQDPQTHRNVTAWCPLEMALRPHQNAVLTPLYRKLVNRAGWLARRGVPGRRGTNNKRTASQCRILLGSRRELRH